MFTRTRVFSLTITVLLTLTLLPGTPTAATSPSPLPVEREWPQMDRMTGGPATSTNGIAGTANVEVMGQSVAPTVPLPSPADRGMQAAAAPVFFDDMEGDVSDWTATGFWHQVTNPQNISVYHVGATTPDDPPNDVNPDLVTLPDTDASGRAYLGSAHSGSQVFWYGVDQYGCFIDPAGTFNPATQSAKNGGKSSGANSGNLVSPAIDLTGLTEATLHFWTRWEIEGVDANMFDLMYVEISTDGGSNWSTIGTLNPINDVSNAHYENYSSGGSKATPVWVHPTFDISSYVGNVVKIHFRFDTVDSQYNGFRGWMIDDVIVDSTGISAPQIYGVFPDCVEVANLGTKIVTIYGADFERRIGNGRQYTGGRGINRRLRSDPDPPANPGC